MTENLRAPRFADQLIVLQNAAMGFEPGAFFKCDDKVLMPETHQLGNITGARVGGSYIEWHKFILLRPHLSPPFPPPSSPNGRGRGRVTVGRVGDDEVRSRQLIMPSAIGTLSAMMARMDTPKMMNAIPMMFSM